MSKIMSIVAATQDNRRWVNRQLDASIANADQSCFVEHTLMPLRNGHIIAALEPTSINALANVVIESVDSGGGTKNKMIDSGMSAQAHRRAIAN